MACEIIEQDGVKYRKLKDGQLRKVHEGDRKRLTAEERIDNYQEKVDHYQSLVEKYQKKIEFAKRQMSTKKYEKARKAVSCMTTDQLEAFQKWMEEQGK